MNLVSGYVSDRFGRRPALLWLMAAHVIASFLTAIASTTYWHFIVIRSDDKLHGADHLLRQLVAHVCLEIALLVVVLNVAHIFHCEGFTL